MFHPLWFLLFLQFGLFQCGTGQQSQSVPTTLPHPSSFKFKECNVILISFDALQAAHVGNLGYPRNVTPTIDAVAKHSYCFTNAYVVSSWTIPSTMSWFTGVYPSEHRMVNKFTIFSDGVQNKAFLQKVAPSLVTLADLFQQNGYVTGGFCGNAGISSDFGYGQGFTTYFHEKGTFGGFNRSIPKALDWLRTNRGKKFFLFLHGYDVHGQYEPPGGFDYRFVDKDYDKKYRGTPREQEILREEGLARGKVTLGDADVRFWRAIYDEKIKRADSHFHAFLKELTTLDLSGNTLLILTADHGTEIHEHGRFDHGFTLYDELIHVPLIIQLPGQKVGKRIIHRVSSIDLMPTILDLADLEVPEKIRKQLRGSSLVPALRGKKVRKDIYAETDYREYTFKRSIITPNGWKLIYTLEDKSRELYFLDQDPGETMDLQKSQPHKADELERKLFQHFRAIGHDLTEKRWIRGLNPVYESQTK